MIECKLLIVVGPGCKINRFLFKINRFILYQTNIFPKWMVLVFRLKVFITFAARIRFWRNQNRWKALGVSFPTVFVASKTETTRESYDPKQLRIYITLYYIIMYCTILYYIILYYIMIYTILVCVTRLLLYYIIL